MFENEVLRRIFGPKRDEVTEEWRKLHSFFFNIYIHFYLHSMLHYNVVILHASYFFYVIYTSFVILHTVYLNFNIVLTLY